MPSTVFSAIASTTLAHARTAHLAQAHGIRLLSIKGPVADHYQLRPPRPAADADVWVEPARFEEFCNLLEAQDWHQRVGRETPSVMPSHSRTYIHDEWGCDIDVHHTFPGFFSSAGAAFEALWQGRQQLRIGQIGVMIPSLVGASLIAALHGLRNQNESRQQWEYERIVELVSASFSKEDRREFVKLARSGGAIWPLRELLEHAELETATTPPPRELQQQWTLNRAYGDLGSMPGWWLYLRSLPLRQQPAALARAVWVSRADIPRNSPDVLPSHREAWRYQAARWARGARALARYLRRAR